LFKVFLHVVHIISEVIQIFFKSFSTSVVVIVTIVASFSAGSVSAGVKLLGNIVIVVIVVVAA